MPPPAGTWERAFGDYAPGRYAWVLADVLPLPRPVPWRGEQGLFEVPDVAIERARERV